MNYPFPYFIQPILLSVVSKAGLLYVFQHRLNGPMQKPLNPKVTINVIDSNSNDVFMAFFIWIVTMLVSYESYLFALCPYSFVLPVDSLCLTN